MTYVHLKLVLKPGEVEVEITLLHQVWMPAGQLSDDTGRHVLNKLILAIQQVQEWLPRVTHPSFTEDLHSAFILLQCKSYSFSYGIPQINRLFFLAIH